MTHVTLSPLERRVLGTFHNDLYFRSELVEQLACEACEEEVLATLERLVEWGLVRQVGVMYAISGHGIARQAQLGKAIA